MIFASYLYNNNPYPILDDIDHYSWFEYVRQKTLGNHLENDSVIYINIAFDKQLIPLYDEYEMPIGNIDVTNRRSLTYLLQLLKKEASYKYIFLDVRFEKGYNDTSVFNDNDSISPTVDEALFSEIRNTDRIVIAGHRDMDIACDSLKEKVALSDYMSTITATNFVRYEYLYDGNKS